MYRIKALLVRHEDMQHKPYRYNAIMLAIMRNGFPVWMMLLDDLKLRPKRVFRVGVLRNE